MISTGSVAPRLRSDFSSVRPSLPGSPRSSSSSSNGSLFSTSAAWAPSCTQSTVKPSRFKPARMASPIIGSSSTKSSLTVCEV
jgi:hypothetical protein